MKSPQNGLLIGVVGPCAAGKSTLVASLRSKGYIGKHIAQEHSYVQDMWKRITDPDILVFLEVSYPASVKRRKLDWTETEYQVQLSRLENAHRHADLVIFTDPLTPEQVLDRVLDFLNE